MDGRTEFQDWEFLHDSDAGGDTPLAFREILAGSDDDDGAIKPDYFALASERRYARSPALEGSEKELGIANSDDPSWVVTESGSGRLSQEKFELGFPEIEFSNKDEEDSERRSGKGGIFMVSGSEVEVGSEGMGERSGNLQFFEGIEGSRVSESDNCGIFVVPGSKIELGNDGIEVGCGNLGSFRGIEGNDELGCGEFVAATEKEEAFHVGGLKMEVGFEEIGEGSGNLDCFGGTVGRNEAENQKEVAFQVGGSEMELGFERVEAGHQNSDGSCGIGESGGIEGEDEKPKEELGSGEFVEMRGGESDLAVEVSDGSVSACEGEKRRLAWWKMPLQLLQFCAFRVRPVWSISVAATILGVVMLVRRLYRLKHKSRRIPLKISIDDKKASQLVVGAARLNEAAIRGVPIIRSQLPAGGVTPWPAVALLL